MSKPIKSLALQRETIRSLRVGTRLRTGAPQSGQAASAQQASAQPGDGQSAGLVASYLDYCASSNVSRPGSSNMSTGGELM